MANQRIFGSKRTKANYSTSKYDNQEPPKHSGCKMKNSYMSKQTGEVINAPIIYGWNVSKRFGMMTFVAVPRKKGSDTSNPNQKMFFAKVTKEKSKPEYYLAFWNLQTKKLTIPDLKMVANPNARRGGYFGKFFETKSR